jgi:hypothetical protein
MNRNLIFSFIVALFALTSCDKGITTASALYKGVVLHNQCCNIVIQNLGNPAVGQAVWVDSNRADYPVYYDVFKVANPCQFINHKEGDTIMYRVVVPQAQNCACCMLFLYTPSVSKSIAVLQ